MLSSLSLWPLAQAIQTGELVPALVALDSAAGGIGDNLLANRIQVWKNRVEDLTEADAAEWITTEIQKIPIYTKR